MFVEDKPLYWCKTNNYLPVLTALGCHGMKLIRFLGPMTDGVNMSRIFVKSKLIKIELHGNVLYLVPSLHFIFGTFAMCILF